MTSYERCQATDMNARPEFVQRRPPPALALWLPALWLFGLLLLLANTGATALKENPLFWRTAGGYPIELREAVLSFYYPLLAVSAVTCGIYSGLVTRRSAAFGRSAVWAISGAVLLWVLLFLDVGLLTANNLQNVLNGRPVHYHPEYGQP